MLMILVCISLILAYSFVFLSLTLSSTAVLPSRPNWACKHLLFAHQGDERGATDSFNRHVNLRSFREGDLVLAYDIAHDTFSQGKFESLWHGPYIIQHCLTKGTYILASPEGLSLKEPVNGLYLKKFYA
jgi:hypothetical protein